MSSPSPCGKTRSGRAIEIVVQALPFPVREDAKFHSLVWAAKKRVVLNDFSRAAISRRSSYSNQGIIVVNLLFDFDISGHGMQCFATGQISE